MASRPLEAGGFTLAELLVSVGVVTLLTFLATQLFNGAATVIILGHKRMDADSEARQVLDRMGIDFVQMVKRTDVDYYVKFFPQQQQQNDQITFYSAVPGYYPTSPSPAPTYTQKSPLSLVSYRINSDNTSSSYNRMERMGKGLSWNGASSLSGWTPLVFVPMTISSSWPSAVSTTTGDSSYEVIGPDVFRFEYYYLLTNGALLESPCFGDNCTLNGWRDVAAIVVDIAVIDPRSKVLLTNQQIGSLNGNASLTNFLSDFHSDLNRPGQLLNQWQARLNRITTLPRGKAIAGIRLYERYFYLKQ
jgi:type II secretory pathway component PulJ